MSNYNEKSAEESTDDIYPTHDWSIKHEPPCYPDDDLYTPKKVQKVICKLESTDKVNHPAHYNHNRKGIEAIIAIEASMSAEEFQGYLKGNILKYLWRYKYKNGVEDLKKAEWYLKKLISVI